MKRSNSINWPFSFGHWMLVLLLLGLSVNVWGQEEEEEPEQISSRMSLSAVQRGEDMAELKALARAKIDGRFTGLPGLEVAFFSLSDTLEKELGKATTDEDGIASLSISKSELYADTAGAFMLAARFDGNDEYSDSDDEITITAATIGLEAQEEDSTRMLVATLESRGLPIAEADVYFYVKGTFRPLKIGEATTDEDGMASVEFPAGLPGNPDGSIDMFVRLEEDDTYGTVESGVSEPWGIPAKESASVTRGLSSPNPPLWLLLTFVALLLIIWGHYLEVIYKLFRLRKKAAEN